MTDRFLVTELDSITWIIFDKKTATKYYAKEQQNGIFLELEHCERGGKRLYGKLPGDIEFDPDNMEMFVNWFKENIAYKKKNRVFNV